MNSARIPFVSRDKQYHMINNEGGMRDALTVMSRQTHNETLKHKPLNKALRPYKKQYIAGDSYLHLISPATARVGALI